MTDDYYQPPPLKSIEVKLDVTQAQFDKLYMAMADSVLLMVVGVEAPMRERWQTWEKDVADCSITLKSIGTTERLK
jgi:hypothetical protein